MVYVALLRGINVGGKNKVEMNRLKATFERLGLQNVKTFINSGNVVFSSDLLEKELTSQLEGAIEKDFGFKVPVLLRSQQQIKKLLNGIPKSWVNDQATKCDVMFLWPEFDSPKALEQLTINPEIESVQYFPGAIVWRIDRKNHNKSKLVRMIGTPFYKQLTIRNPNTIRKLYTLMSS